MGNGECVVREAGIQGLTATEGREGKLLADLAGQRVLEDVAFNWVLLDGL